MADFNALLDGYRRFRETRWASERERWQQLKEGQSPRVMVIACSDSRVDPAQILDTNPGEIFVVRNVANLVPPYEPDRAYHGVSAALEFAVTQLMVEEIIVMGHAYCGGCAAALTGQFTGTDYGEGGFIARWIDMLADARTKVRTTFPEPFERPAFREMEHEGVRVSLRNLRTFPWVLERERAGSLALHGAFFGIGNGLLHVLDERTGAFAPV